MPALEPPVMPQLALSRAALPEGEEWAYEPKWDGFRALAFVDGKKTFLQSRNGRPLSRYFPELEFPPGDYVLDGELVIFGDGDKQEFELLQQRIHPAESRIKRLAAETPVRFVAFDLLADKGESLLGEPFKRRRALLEKRVRKPLDLTPWTTDRAEAEPWLQGAEGVIAKELDAPYRPGERTGMVKVKRVRTIDTVIVGWRPGKEEGTLGSLILGLYDERGELCVVGHSSGFRAKQKRELPGFLAPYETGERGSGDPSRWDTDRELEWRSLRPELVAEVTFDHVSGRRIRHGAKFKRWREDKPPAECTIDQLKT
ncbi:MAG TPA: ATP-dependent DNA ligase [Solirubrobacterales bacterium]|nr:ATP-dependent DNA ligase [Solirubrobacterales bacterium]